MNMTSPLDGSDLRKLSSIDNKMQTLNTLNQMHLDENNELSAVTEMSEREGRKDGFFYELEKNFHKN